jgi:thiosulfate/3-mercaptopyruvate sulfurtransferase
MNRFLSPHEIQSLIHSDAVILDARPVPLFLESHIPGARLVDFVSPKFLIRSASDLEQFQVSLEQIFSAVGLSSAAQVVVYDSGPENRAARTAWALEYAGCEVGILQGGFPAWLAAGLPISSEVETILPSDFKVRARPELLATADEIKASLQKGNLESGEILVLDARDTLEFRGEKIPAGASRGGHIPGAKHFEWLHVMTSTGFKSAAELDAALETIPKDREIAVHCQSGARSAAVFQVLKDRGYRVKNYLGSMNEWLSSEDLPVETGS